MLAPPVQAGRCAAGRTARRDISELPKDSLILPLYLIDHSGISMNTTGSRARGFGPGGDYPRFAGADHARWGAGDDARELATRCLQSEVAHYDEHPRRCWLRDRGREVCDHGDLHWEQTDSCWGFIGADPFTNGMSEHVPSELHDKLREAAQAPEYS